MTMTMTIISASMLRRRPSVRKGPPKNDGADLEEARKREGFYPLRNSPLSMTVGWRLPAKDSISTLFAFAFVFAFAILAIIFIDITIAIAHKWLGSRGPVRPSEENLNNLEITFAYNQRQHQNTHRVLAKNLQSIDPPEGPSYNGIEFWPMEGEAIFSRRIDPEDSWRFEEYRAQALHANDQPNLESRYEPDEDLEDVKRPCRRNNWRSKQFPNCNAFVSRSN
jgi:hypothetical protein